MAGARVQERRAALVPGCLHRRMALDQGAATQVKAALDTRSGSTNPAEVRRELAGSPPSWRSCTPRLTSCSAASRQLQARIRSLRGYPIVVNIWGSMVRTRAARSSTSSRRPRPVMGRRVAFIGADVGDNTGDARALPAPAPRELSELPDHDRRCHLAPAAGHHRNADDDLLQRRRASAPTCTPTSTSRRARSTQTSTLTRSAADGRTWPPADDRLARARRRRRRDEQQRQVEQRVVEGDGRALPCRCAPQPPGEREEDRSEHRGGGHVDRCRRCR